MPGGALSESQLDRFRNEGCLRIGSLLDAGALVVTSGAVTVELPAGGVMFHYCQTFHSTPPNRTDRQRHTSAIHYMRPGTWSHRVEAMPVGFGRPLLRLPPKAA